MTMGHAAMQAAFAAAILDPALAMPAGLTTARGIPDAQRFAVYRNNVAVGLRKALAARFPLVERLVGDEFFALMARAYIARSKPASPLLFAYGDSLPEFIEGFAPAAADAPTLGIAQLAALPPEKLGAARLAPHPAATLVRSRFAVGRIWQAHQGETAAPFSASGAEAVLIVRPGLEVGVQILPGRDADFAAAVLDGAALGEAAAQALAADNGFDFGAALVGLAGLGAFADRVLINGDGHD
jgi:hypothetical protein